VGLSREAEPTRLTDSKFPKSNFKFRGAGGGLTAAMGLFLSGNVSVVPDQASAGGRSMRDGRAKRRRRAKATSQPLGEDPSPGKPQECHPPPSHESALPSPRRGARYREERKDAILQVQRGRRSLPRAVHEKRRAGGGGGGGGPPPRKGFSPPPGRSTRNHVGRRFEDGQSRCGQTGDPVRLQTSRTTVVLPRGMGGQFEHTVPEAVCGRTETQEVTEGGPHWRDLMFNPQSFGGARFHKRLAGVGRTMRGDRSG